MAFRTYTHLLCAEKDVAGGHLVLSWLAIGLPLPVLTLPSLNLAVAGFGLHRAGAGISYARTCHRD